MLKKVFGGGGVVWYKVIIVSALSLRDKDRLRDRESLTTIHFKSILNKSVIVYQRKSWQQGIFHVMTYDILWPPLF